MNANSNQNRVDGRTWKLANPVSSNREAHVFCADDGDDTHGYCMIGWNNNRAIRFGPVGPVYVLTDWTDDGVPLGKSVIDANPQFA